MKKYHAFVTALIYLCIKFIDSNITEVYLGSIFIQETSYSFLQSNNIYNMLFYSNKKIKSFIKYNYLIYWIFVTDSSLKSVFFCIVKCLNCIPFMFYLFCSKCYCCC